MERFHKLEEDFERANVRVLLISADTPKRNRALKKAKKLKLSFLSDEDHTVADLYQIPVQRKHPMSATYRDGFIQPAIFVFKGEETVFEFIQNPKSINLWGAAGRPSVKQVLAILSERL